MKSTNAEISLGERLLYARTGLSLRGTVSAGGGPASQLLGLALGLLCVVSASTSQCVESSPMLVM